jgi:hypothetical protein
VAPQRYTIGQDNIVFHSDSLCISEVEPHLMTYVNSFTNLATQGTPNGGT